MTPTTLETTPPRLRDRDAAFAWLARHPDRPDNQLHDATLFDLNISDAPGVAAPSAPID